jgi:dienelactone hydrolase
MGLQTYNSIRALDWFCELPDVDPQRIAVTGASGGGTQTFLLCAVDPRPAVAFPAVMVSTAMQGGCTCENCNYLRVGTGNVEIAALFSPKPLGMSAADDWTKEMESKGLPELKQHYAMLGVPDNVMAKYFPFPHNYNRVSRTLMYHWFNKHLKLGQSEPIEERDFQPLSQAELSVWDDSHPKPPSGDDYERSLLRWMTEDAKRQIAALKPHDFNSLAKYRETVGGAVETMIGRGLPKAGAVEYEATVKNDRGSYIEFVGRLRHPAQGEELPIAFLYPKQWNGKVVVWLDKEGKSVLYDAAGGLSEVSRRMLDEGTSIAGVDLLYQGEFLADGRPLTQTRLVQKGYAGYTFGYNHPLFAQRVHDILTVLSFVRNHEQQPRVVHLVGLGETAPLAAAAGALAGETLDSLAIDTTGFRFQRLTAIDEPMFLPGIVKYGDLPALVALNAPRKLWLAGEGGPALEIVTAAYRALDKQDRLTLHKGEAAEQVDDVLRWLAH